MTGAALTPFADPHARRLVVLGHPGHELAMFGVLQRHQPDAVLVISDGGSSDRTEQSRRGFASIDRLACVRYLGYPEPAFYRALLDADAAFLRAVVADLRGAFEAHRPTQIFCDAIEFYNPIHDITLALVRAALGESRAVVYELPLVYEVSGAEDLYRVQRAPDQLAHRRVVFDLSAREIERKAVARDTIYRSLHEQAGPDLLKIPYAGLAREELFVSEDRVSRPGAYGRALRYERRARLLHAEGRIARMIVYADHIVPMLDALGVPYDAE